MGIIIQPRRTNDDQNLIDRMEDYELILDLKNKRLVTKAQLSDDSSASLIEYISPERFTELFKNRQIGINPEDFLNYFDSDIFSINSETNKITVNISEIATSSTTQTEYSLGNVENNYPNLSNLAQYTFSINYDGGSWYINRGSSNPQDVIYNWGNAIYVNSLRVDYNSSLYRGFGFLLFKFSNVSSLRVIGNIITDNIFDKNITLTSNEQVYFDLDNPIYLSYKINHTTVSHAIHHLVFSNKIVSSHYYSPYTKDDYDEYRFSEKSDVVFLVMWTKSNLPWNGDSTLKQKIIDTLFKG